MTSNGESPDHQPVCVCVRACECLEWDVCAVAFPATFRAVGYKLFPEHREVFQEHGYKW